MSETIFLAGGSGVVGLALIPRLVAAEYRVVASTQSDAKFKQLQDLGAEPVVMDAFDAQSVKTAVVASKASVIIHQLTSLPDGLAPELMKAASDRNAQIRDQGTRHLVAAAIAVGARRMVAQSIAFAYVPGKALFTEDDPLAESHWGVRSLETQVMSGPFEGVVLRYGYFYGRRTGTDFPARAGSLHVADAAEAALLAVKHGPPGIYNIAEEGGPFDVTKAVKELGFQPRQHDS